MPSCLSDRDRSSLKTLSTAAPTVHRDADASPGERTGERSGGKLAILMRANASSSAETQNETSIVFDNRHAKGE